MTKSRQHPSSSLSTASPEYSSQRLPRACGRCGGFLIDCHCISPDQGTSDFEIAVKRCLQCGDIIDDVILRNRTTVERSESQLRREKGKTFDRVSEMANN